MISRTARTSCPPRSASWTRRPRWWSTRDAGPRSGTARSAATRCGEADEFELFAVRLAAADDRARLRGGRQVRLRRSRVLCRGAPLHQRRGCPRRGARVRRGADQPVDFVQPGPRRPPRARASCRSATTAHPRGRTCGASRAAGSSTASSRSTGRRASWRRRPASRWTPPTSTTWAGSPGRHAARASSATTRSSRPPSSATVTWTVGRAVRSCSSTRRPCVSCLWCTPPSWCWRRSRPGPPITPRPHRPTRAASPA